MYKCIEVSSIIVNMTFRPKVVDWECSLRPNKKWIRSINSSIKCTPIQIFATGQVRQWNGAKPSKTWVLDRKKWNGHVCCKKTRNGSGGINSCNKCTSIQVLASNKECLELLVNFMNKILIQKTFKTTLR